MSHENAKMVPNHLQRQLLRVAVLDDSTARREWAEWRAGGGSLDDLDPWSQSALPQLYLRLSELAVNDPDMARLKGTYRHRWCENVAALRAARPVITILSDAGIETLVFKGAALMIGYGRGPGARPMGDVDIVVKPSDARRGLDVLVKAGYRSSDGFEPFGTLRVRRSLNLLAPGKDSMEVDLHWTTLPSAEGSDGVFQRARAAELLGVPTLVPSPADLLLSIITHGTNWYPEPVRWVLDSSYLLSHQSTGIDWELLARRARQHHYAWQVGTALVALEDDYGAAVPPGVARSLLSTPGEVLDGVMWRFQRHMPPHGVRYLFLFNEWWRARRTPYPGGRAGGLLSFAESHVEATGPLDLVHKLWPKWPTAEEPGA